MEISWDWQRSRSGFFTFAGLCMLCMCCYGIHLCTSSTCDDSCRAVRKKKCLGHPISTGAICHERHPELLFYSAYSMVSSPSHRRRHTHCSEKSYIGWQLSSYMGFGNMICCSYWKWARWGGADNIFWYCWGVGCEICQKSDSVWTWAEL